ncbi:hypothetical protein DPMN_141517 [Dreissena polymorpha]|uniref:Uncharacterized protein n=1 Tax=Dreissena polymorpha TaxID=45954 RepID=A0A9D4G9V0_DREPO|nr:hypothetical protein DPMN_141517 [Dreissena polymorpha]
MDMASAQRPGGHRFDPHRGSAPQISPKTPSTGSMHRKRTRERQYKPQAPDAIDPK